MRQKIQNLIQQAKAIVLDFDGTLVNSNRIKRRAFEKCFADYPKQFDAIMQYCKTNNHIPRQIKFRHVFEKILFLPYTAEIEQQMLSRYAKETTAQVIAAQEIPGATEFLKRFVFGRESALLSSTPHAILLHILEKRGMKHYFKIIQGAPVNKAKWIQAFLSQRQLRAEEIVFIGDSPEDIHSAKEIGIPFVGVAEANPEEVLHYLPNFEAVL